MTRIPVLITGGKGMLGTAFKLESDAFSRFEVRTFGRDELDVRDVVAMASACDWVSGGWVVHCAAHVDVEGCAREPEAARETIVTGTRNAAKLARDANARLLYPQSFLIYDGRDNPIAEGETPRPLSLYGELKLEAEEIVQDLVEDPLVIRMAGFFGGEAADKNFIGRIIPVMHAAMARGETRFEVGNRVWQPTWTRDLAYNALHLMRRSAGGVYHMACQGHASFAELAQVIVIALGWGDRFTIVSVDASAVSQSELGRRPDVAILSCDRLNREHANLQRSWQATLHAYLQHEFFDQYRMETNR